MTDKLDMSAAQNYLARNFGLSLATRELLEEVSKILNLKYPRNITPQQRYYHITKLLEDRKSIPELYIEVTQNQAAKAFVETTIKREDNNDITYSFHAAINITMSELERSGIRYRLPKGRFGLLSIKNEPDTFVDAHQWQTLRYAYDALVGSGMENLIPAGTWLSTLTVSSIERPIASNEQQ